MGKLSYPVCYRGGIGQRGSWRWAETNTASNNDFKPAHPCCSNECDGHNSAHIAQLHHAIWFCDNAEVELRLEKDCRKRCAGCEQWTTQRVKFAGCPFDDWITVCHGCDARTYLKIQHFIRRGILQFIRSHVEAKPQGVVVRERYNPAYTEEVMEPVLDD